MTPIEIILIAYLVVMLGLLWRNTILCNRRRAEVLISRGTKTTFTSFIPFIVRESLLWPLTILWHGLKTFLTELE